MPALATVFLGRPDAPCVVLSRVNGVEAGGELVEEGPITTVKLAEIMRERYGIDKKPYSWQRLARLKKIPGRPVYPGGPYVFNPDDLDLIAELQGWEGKRP